jgi:rhodanese-related sulfurtransferase
MRRTLVQATALLALASGAAWCQWCGDPAARKIVQRTSLKPGEVLMADAMRWNPVWIDARARKDYEHGHLPGAYLLTLNESENFDLLLFEIERAGVLDGSRPVVVYCYSGRCDLSAEVAARLRERDPRLRVFTLHGGWPG